VHDFLERGIYNEHPTKHHHQVVQIKCAFNKAREVASNKVFWSSEITFTRTKSRTILRASARPMPQRLTLA